MYITSMHCKFNNWHFRFFLARKQQLRVKYATAKCWVPRASKTNVTVQHKCDAVSHSRLRVITRYQDAVSAQTNPQLCPLKQWAMLLLSRYVFHMNHSKLVLKQSRQCRARVSHVGTSFSCRVFLLASCSRFANAKSLQPWYFRIRS